MLSLGEGQVEHYCSILRQFLATEGTNAELWLASQPGVGALLASQSISEIIAIHQEALSILLKAYSEVQDIRQIALRASEFLARVFLRSQENQVHNCDLARVELRDSKIRFRSLFEQMSIGVCYNDLEGRFLQANHRFCKIVGFTLEELQTKRCLDIIYPEDVDANTAYFSQLAAGEISHFSTENRYVCKDGSAIWGQVTVSLVDASTNGSKYFLTIIQDISDRKQAEISLRQLNAELEARVNERTNTLARVNQYLLTEIAARKQTEKRLVIEIERLHWINTLASELNAANTLDEIYAVALKGIQNILATKRAAILIFDDRGIPRYQASVGISEAYKQAVENYCASQSKLTATHLVTISDTKQKKGDEQLDILRQIEGIQAAISFPIQYQEKHLGKVVVYYNAPHQFSNEETQLVQAIATYTAVAVTRKNSEIALLESQSYAVSIAESIPDMLYVYNLAEQRNTYSNQAILKVMGYTPEEIAALESDLLQTLMHPDDFATLPNYFEQMHKLAIGEVIDLTYRLRHANGEWRWIYSRDKVLRKDANGRTMEYIGTARDITDTKATELKLKQQLAAMETSADGIAILDLNGIFTYANNAHAATFGCNDVSEIVGKSWKDLYDRETIDFVEKDVVPHILANGVWKGELLGKKKDGTHFPVEVSITSISHEGQLQGAVCIYRDVSDRKQAEAELQATQKRFQSILDNCPAAIYVFDTAEKHVLVNRFYEQKSGYTNAELRGKSHFDIWPNELATEVSATLRQVISSGKPMEIEETIPHGDGFIYAVTLRFPLLDDRGVPDAVCSISTDITDRRIAEMKLEASLKEKELLLQEIHHRVKNNLQVVASLLNLQQRTIQDPAVAQLFEDSRNRVYTMAAVHEKLYQSKSLDRINLGDYLRDLVNGLIQSYNVNSNYIQFEINTDLINVNIETAIPCGLIVNELVTNIVKHAFPDRRQGKVLVECLATSDGSIQLKVCDNGVGIPAHIDLSRASSLGLRIIGQLSRQLKGKMKIEATEGTCFALKFAELKYRNRI